MKKCPNCGFPYNGRLYCEWCNFPVWDDLEVILHIWKTNFLFNQAKIKQKEVRIKQK